MHMNRTSEWKVMIIWISRELSLFNFERLDILCAWIGSPSEKLWPFEFLESFRCSIMSVWIYYEPESDLRVKSYEHLNFLSASVVQFVRLDILCTWIGPLSEMLWPFKFLESFRCSISRASIYYVPESNLRVKSFHHLNCSWASIVEFWASRYIMRRIGHPSEKLWPFEFLESFRCWISSVSIYYAPESDLRVRSYDHLNF